MFTPQKILLLVASVAMISGCGKKDEKSGTESKSGDEAKSGSTKIVASCDAREVVAAFKVCNDYTGSMWTVDDAKSSCEGSIDAKFAATACPTEGVVFSCKVRAGQASESISRYYDKADKAREMCGVIKGTAL